MEWWGVILLILGGLMLLLATGLPVAFSFLVVNLVAGYMVWGGTTGFEQLIDSVYSSVTMFALLPVPLFIIMGEVLLNSGLAFKSVDIVDKWLGRVPGRLGLVAVSSATIFSSLSGSSMGTTAMLGRILVPEMQRRGYKAPISIGACMSGGLAMIIPPSALGVILAAVAQVSVGKLLIAGVIPGLILAFFYIVYIVGRCTLQPSLAPPYDPEPVPLSEKAKNSLKYLLPLGGIIVLVIGLIFLGIATPTESAGIGAMATFLLAAAYRRFNLELVKKVLTGTLRICVMMFMILTGSLAFSQLLAFTGATSGLVQFASELRVHPLLLIFAMQLVILVLGTFMEQVAIMMITLPIFMPIVNAMGFEGVWFALIMLINLEIAMKSPPFGFLLFVMKSVAPKGTTMAQIYGATFPFILIDIFGMGLVVFFPALALWLPSFMAY
jgi:tripartite ATP-independent transporter DctM subunit